MIKLLEFILHLLMKAFRWKSVSGEHQFRLNKSPAFDKVSSYMQNLFSRKLQKQMLSNN